MALEIERTRIACAGVATAFLLRSLGQRAGAYRPGAADLFDRLLFDLSREEEGGDLSRVARWFTWREAELARLGHRYGARMVAFRTPTILSWVAAGLGHRGAVVVTSGELLHPGAGISAPHALALTFDGARRGEDSVTAIDPWPGIYGDAPLPSRLEVAHRRCLHRAFLLYSYGWS